VQAAVVAEEVAVAVAEEVAVVRLLLRPLRLPMPQPTWTMLRPMLP
jgi:hypothetical protein